MPPTSGNEPSCLFFPAAVNSTGKKVIFTRIFCIISKVGQCFVRNQNEKLTAFTASVDFAGTIAEVRINERDGRREK